jgi:ferritin
LGHLGRLENENAKELYKYIRQTLGTVWLKGVKDVCRQFDETWAKLDEHINKEQNNRLSRHTV